MQAYLVRLNAMHTSPHDLVGLFVAETTQQLAEIVDECCDVSGCEYARLPAGGIYMSDQAVAVPAAWDDTTPDLEFFTGATPSEWWNHFFFEQADQPRWRPLSWTENDTPIATT